MENQLSTSTAPEKNEMTTTLSPDDQQRARELSTKIEDTTSSVIDYGADAQNKLSSFSQNLLSRVQSQDTGEVGSELANLMTRLNEANPDELRAEDRNIFRKIFKHVKRSIYEVTAKYQKIGAQIDMIASRLEGAQAGLMNDNKMLDELYQQNKSYFDDLNIYIEAANIKLNELNTVTIPKKKKEATEQNNQMLIQQVKDLQDFALRLDKRNYDLQLARELSIQQAPQIRMIQNTNQVLAEKIQSSINTAIPLWKNQVAIALAILRQKDAVTAQRQVSQTTNDLLKKNSDMLKISSIETAKENERGVVDIETLQQTQNDLLETIKGVMEIQQNGVAQRQAAEEKLSQMESQLKEKMLEYAKNERKDITPDPLKLN